MSNLRIIENDKTIGDLFNNLSRNERIPISVQIKGKKSYAMLKFTDEQHLPYVCYENNDIEMQKGDKFEMTMFYKETFINFPTKVQSKAGEKYYIEKPETITTSFKRTKTRYVVKKEDGVFVSVYGLSNKYPVIDISTSGLSFEADKELFDEGQVIRNIMLVLTGNQIVYIDGVVCNVTPLGDSYYRFGMQFISIEWMFYQKIFSYIFEKSYPDIKLLKECSLDIISSLYNESRYIRPKNSNGRDLMTDIQKLERLKSKSMISINLIQQKDGEIDAIASAIRSYNKAFYIQQILTMPDAEMENVQKTDLYVGITDSLLGHPYFDSLLMYVNNDVVWQLDMMRIMQEIINDNEKVTLEPYSVCKFASDYCCSKTGLKATQTNDFSSFIKYCDETMSEAEKNTFCLKNNNYELGEIKEVYQSLGYFIARKLYEIKQGKELVAYVVVDVFSEEVDIDGNLNSAKIYLIKKSCDINEVIKATANEVAVLYGNMGISHFNTFCRERVSESQFEDVELVHRLIMSRDGVVEFLYFLKANII